MCPSFCGVHQNINTYASIVGSSAIMLLYKIKETHGRNAYLFTFNSHDQIVNSPL